MCVRGAVVRRCEHLRSIPHVSDHNAVCALLERRIRGAGGGSSGGGTSSARDGDDGEADVCAAEAVS